jgi:23S rRNA G2445 N2-methylase RlmL
MIEIFAVTTRGLESVSAEEVAAVDQTHVREVSYRRVTARCTGPLIPLFDLRTVDDIFLSVGTWLDIGSNRAALGAIRRMSSQLNLYRAAAIVEGLRPIRRPPAFSVTANFVGRRDYTTPDIKEACSAGVRDAHYGWKYASDDREADLNVRLFIEHDTAFVGVRLAAEPLQNRAYKIAHVPGSLKPPVAAALVRMSGPEREAYLLDPCCGAGTILVEGARMEIPTLGGDNDPKAVTASLSNIAAANVSTPVLHWDARHLPLTDDSVPRVVTNPPWGRKVDIESDLRSFYRALGQEISRVLEQDGRAVVLTWAPAWVRAWPLNVQAETEISLYGRKPTVMVLTH